MAIKRDSTGKFERGHGGGPGRPRDGITNALRRMIDPEEIAGFLINAVKGPGVRMSDRLKAAELIYDRLEGKAIASINVTAGPSLPPGWNAMTKAEQVDFLDRVQYPLIEASSPEPDGEEV